MVKLKFSNLEVTTDGTITSGKIIATTKFLFRNKWSTIKSKRFNTKVTLKAGDKFDLNKAYKYIQAKLERNAYAWALKQIKEQIKFVERDLKIYTDFKVKAQHIVNHDDEYLNKF